MERHLEFLPQQYELFIDGEGIDGDPSSAALIDESVSIFTNTPATPSTPT